MHYPRRGFSNNRRYHDVYWVGKFLGKCAHGRGLVARPRWTSFAHTTRSSRSRFLYLYITFLINSKFFRLRRTSANFVMSRGVYDTWPSAQKFFVVQTMRVCQYILIYTIIHETGNRYSHNRIHVNAPFYALRVHFSPSLVLSFRSRMLKDWE